jgi:hypothetical protein
MRPKKARVLGLVPALLLACLFLGAGLSVADDRGASQGQGEPTLTRVHMQVRGLVSPRAAQNVFIRLDKQKGVRAFRCNLGSNVILVDFQPNQQVSKEEAERVIRSAGWTPGWIKSEQVPVRQAVADEAGEYWYVLPQLEGASGLKRWLVINFALWTRNKDLSIPPSDPAPKAPNQGRGSNHE